MEKTDFEILFNEAVNGMAFVSAKGEWLHVNQSFCDMLGYSKEELLKIDFQSITHPDDLQADIDWIKDAMAGKTSHLSREKRYIHKEGHAVWIDLRVTLCRFDDGSPKYFIAQITDISERVKDHLAREKAQLKLEQVMNIAVDAIIMANSNGIIESYNKGAENMFGFQADEALGKPISLLMPKSEGRNHQVHIDRYLISGRSKIVGMSRELMACKKDGSTFPIKLSLSSSTLNGEKIFVAVIHDISDVKSMQQSLLDQKYTAEHASRAKSEFLSNMSHELRTPLNAILGFAQLLQMNSKKYTDESRASHLQQIMNSGHHLLNLVNEILDLTLIESGRQEFNFSSVNVNEIVHRAVTTIKPMAMERNINIDVNIETSKCALWVDEQKCFQVLVNLLSNAVKYNRENGFIHVSCIKANEGYCRLIVKDSGEGITADKRQFVFQPFERFSARKHSVVGSGVGLTLTKSLVENMKGNIDFDSIPDQGSSFWVEFPNPSDPNCCN